VIEEQIVAWRTVQRSDLNRESYTKPKRDSRVSVFVRRRKTAWGWNLLEISRRTTAFRFDTATALPSRTCRTTFPPPGPQEREPLRRAHPRRVGVARHRMYRTTFGIELRLHLGDELIESRLSRYGEAPLLLIAEQAK
jgi:hypothetical protein